VPREWEKCASPRWPCCAVRKDNIYVNALAAWCCGHRLRHRNRRSWVRISWQISYVTYTQERFNCKKTLLACKSNVASAEIA
jgi:hypothetical protein